MSDNTKCDEQHSKMNKRSAVDVAPGAPPAKRLQVQGLEDLYIDDHDDDFTPAHTPSSMAEPDSPLTTNTGATTPRAKFPSDLKTLACTWPGCSKTFNRPARLRDHLNSHTNSRPFKCSYDNCDKDYIEDKHLKQHVKAVHTLERKHVCHREGCGKSFVTGTRLKRHQAVHEGAERFRCQDCGQSFRKKETLNKHVRKEHRGLPAHQCPCQGCEAAFDSKAALKRHHDKEHGEVKYWCGECGLKRLPDGTEQRVGFTTEVLLQAHIRQEHQNCMFCDFKSRSQWELERHVEVHHSGNTVEDRKTIPCPYDNCMKKFTRKSNLTAHIQTAHEGFRFVCGEVILSSNDLQGWTNDQGCGNRFSTKARLEDHVRYRHLGHERPKLSMAGDSMVSDLIDEISGAVNLDKQAIPCLQCTETFIRYHDLEVHFQKEHVSVDNLGLFRSQNPPPLTDHSPPFGNDFAQTSSWPEEVQGEEFFSAQMDYGPTHDDWPEDEENILLLARDPEPDPLIDPALCNFHAQT